MDKFAIGEVVWLLPEGNARGTTVGQKVECTVVSPAFMTEYGFSYEIMVPGDPCLSEQSKAGEWRTLESFLRKKKPPEEPGSWEEVQEIVNWNPTKEKIT